MKTLKYILPVFLLAILSCKKDNRTLNADIQPEGDLLSTSFSSSAPVYATTVKHDRIISFNSDNIKYIGSNHDPVFGRTDVGLYVNASIAGGLTNVSFGTEPEIVSSEIILEVPSLDFVGTYTNSLNFVVHPVTTALSTGSVYFSTNDSLHSKSSVLGSYTGSFTVMEGKLVIRIPVDNNYANAIISNPQYLVDNSTFQNTYKGFYITAESSNLNPVSAQGYLSKVDLAGSLSGFYIYYKSASSSAVKTEKTYKFSFTGSSAVRYNTVKYNPADDQNMDLKNQVLGNSVADQKIYLKGLGGTRARITIPDIKSYADSFKVAVNRAEVIFNVDPSSFAVSNAQYLAPPRLTLFAIDSLGRENYTVDQLNATDMARYGGTYDDVNKRYVFNIARHVQAILSGKKKNYGFYLVATNPEGLNAIRRDTYSQRVILSGTATSLKPVFNLNYIKFKND